jgi:hypothetical protein
MLPDSFSQHHPYSFVPPPQFSELYAYSGGGGQGGPDPLEIGGPGPPVFALGGPVLPRLATCSTPATNIINEQGLFYKANFYLPADNDWQLIIISIRWSDQKNLIVCVLHQIYRQI